MGWPSSIDAHPDTYFQLPAKPGWYFSIKSSKQMLLIPSLYFLPYFNYWDHYPPANPDSKVWMLFVFFWPITLYSEPFYFILFYFFTLSPFNQLASTIDYVGFPGGSDGKESACNVGDPGSIPGWEDPLEKGTATHSSVFPGEFHGQRSPVDCSPWGHKELDTTEQLIPPPPLIM